MTAREDLMYVGCTLTVKWGDIPEPDTFLVTSGGSAYRVDSVDGQKLHCTRWPRESIPADAEVWDWKWAAR